MIKGPFSTTCFCKLVALLFLLPSLAIAQYPDFYYLYNYSIPNQSNNYCIPTYLSPSYPFAPAGNFTAGVYSLSNLFALSSLYTNYAYYGAYPLDGSRFQNINTVHVPENNGFAGFNFHYTNDVVSNVTGTWVGRFAKSFSRNSNSWGNNEGIGGDNQATYPINLNLTQYDGLVSGIAVLTENNVTKIVNVDGNISGTQVTLVGFLPDNESLRFKTNATIQGNIIRGSYTINDFSLLTTVEVGSFNVTKQ